MKKIFTNTSIGNAFISIFFIVFLLFLSLIYFARNNKCLAYILACTIFIIYIVVFFIILKIVNKQNDKHYIKELEKIKNELNSDFKPFSLNVNISKEHAVCKAKIDENGKIICKINVDLQKEFDSYEEFLKLLL